MKGYLKKTLLGVNGKSIKCNHLIDYECNDGIWRYQDKNGTVLYSEIDYLMEHRYRGGYVK